MVATEDSGHEAAKSDNEGWLARYIATPEMHEQAEKLVAAHLQVPVGRLRVEVPPDGKCLLYCFNAALDRVAWQLGRSKFGNREGNAAESAADVELATKLLTQLVDRTRAAGDAQEADRLMLFGSDGYPGQDNLSNLAFITKRRVEVYSLRWPEAAMQ